VRLNISRAKRLACYVFKLIYRGVRAPDFDHLAVFHFDDGGAQEGGFQKAIMYCRSPVGMLDSRRFFFTAISPRLALTRHITSQRVSQTQQET
jgi:hypothetical protein